MNSLRNFCATFAIALVVFGLCAFFITGFVTDSINGMISGEKATESSDVSTSDSDSSALHPLGPDEDDLGGTSFSMLLIGTDYRPSILTDYHPNIEEQYPYFQNSAELIGYNGSLPVYPYRTVHADAVVLVTVNKEKRRITYMEIPTEMQLTVGGVTTNVRDLYYDKGLDYFVNKMSGITGVQIDYYALTSIEQLAGAVDAMGNITFTVPCDMEYTDEASGLTISLDAGVQTLTGNDVCGLLAYNSYTNATLSREKTTMSFLRALAQKMTNPTYLPKAATIFADASKYVATNFTAEDLTKQLDLIFAYSQFEVGSVDYPGSYYFRDGERVFIPNFSAAITAMLKYNQ